MRIAWWSEVAALRAVGIAGLALAVALLPACGASPPASPEKGAAASSPAEDTAAKRAAGAAIAERPSGLSPGLSPGPATSASPVPSPGPGPALAGRGPSGGPGDGGTSPDQEREEQERRRAEAQTAAASGACKELTAALAAGRRPDVGAVPSLRGQERRLERAALLLATCRAAALDSDLPCAAVADQAAVCRVRRAYLRAATEAGRARGAAPLAEAVFALCERWAQGADCAAVREAVRRDDPAACPRGREETAALCAVFLDRDPGRCPKSKGDFASACPAEAKWTSLLKAGGLPRLAFDGSEDDRLLANAADGRIEACNVAQDALYKACLGVAAPPPPNPGNGPGLGARSQAARPAAPAAPVTPGPAAQRPAAGSSSRR